MNAAELKVHLSAGPIAVEFGPGIEDFECYAEPKMRAHLVAVDFHQDDVVLLKFEYSEFDEYNKAFESANYFDKNGEPTLTAREAGYYSIKEDIYVMAHDDLQAKMLTLLNSSSLALIAEFKNSGQKSYVRWLEEQLTAVREKGA